MRGDGEGSSESFQHFRLGQLEHLTWQVVSLGCHLVITLGNRRKTVLLRLSTMLFGDYTFNSICCATMLILAKPIKPCLFQNISLPPGWPQFRLLPLIAHNKRHKRDVLVVVI